MQKLVRRCMTQKSTRVRLSGKNRSWLFLGSGAGAFAVFVFLLFVGGCGSMTPPPLFEQRRCFYMKHAVITLWPHICDFFAVVIDLIEMI